MVHVTPTIQSSLKLCLCIPCFGVGHKPTDLFQGTLQAKHSNLKNALTFEFL